MSITHTVTLIGQITDNLCWYAVYQMLEAWYNRIQPKRPPAFTSNQLARLKSLNWGVKPEAVPGFANLMGLNVLTPTPSVSTVEQLLSTYGPIWYPGKNLGFIPSTGTHHAVLIRGITGHDLLINDPSPVGIGTSRRMPASAFFQQLQPVNNQFLVMLANSKPNIAAIQADLGVR
ncbi:MAG: papain-like cysteine protease family protein [Candidatus Methylumidiphilus sp.]